MKVKEILKDCEQWTPPRNTGLSSPMVSVLLPTFRRAQCGLFEKAVQSVINQDFKNWELIIIDDASTDGTADLITHFMKNDDRIGCIRHRFNVGLPAISEYEGYMKARGEYIAFIFDDNEWERDYLSQTINLMVRKKLDASYGIVRCYYTKDNYIELGKADQVRGIHSLDAINFIANGGVILRRSVIETVGLYDPHIAVTRLCDWELWKRVIKHFTMYETGILASSEKGVILSDSLGNSYKLNSWAVAERANQVNDTELLPKNFADIEINSVDENSSVMYRDYIEENYRDYNKKRWYKEEKSKIVDGKTRHILVIANSYDASCELVFGRLKKADSSLVLRFGTEVLIADLAIADAIILIRNPIATGKYRSCCEALKIPCYLYLDDNYLCLDENEQIDSLALQIKKELQSERTQNYNGILVTTAALQEHYQEKGLHGNVLLIEPILLNAGEQPEQTECITFAYIGGSFRDKVFETSVLPAIKRIAVSRKIRLVCPSRMNLKGLESFENIEVIQIEFNLSLIEVLRAYGAYRPHILIHCGPDIKNNKYKTENGLINAVQIGAVFAPSKEYPYHQHDGEYYICSENTPDSWYNTLHSLVEDAEKRKSIFNAAQEYCLNRYSVKNAVEEFNRILEGIEPASNPQMLQRLTAGINNYVPAGVLPAGGGLVQSEPVQGGLVSRSLVGKCIVYSGGIRRKRVYRVVCTKESFSQIGICFAYSGPTTGSVKISVTYNRNCLGIKELSFEHCVQDFWTYIDIASKGNMLNKILEITLEYTYETNPKHAGVAEDGEKITLPVKVLRKLNLTRGITDLLFTDFR